MTKLVEPFNPTLFSAASPSKMTREEKEEVIRELVPVLMSSGGIALSANQVGWPQRAFIIKIDKEESSIFNPKIVFRSPEKTAGKEGCVSYPGLQLNIPRHDSIRVRYEDINGNVTTKAFGGVTARVFQHEIDHLDGVPFWRRVSKFSLKRAVEDSNKKRKTKWVYSLFHKHYDIISLNDEDEIS